MPELFVFSPGNPMVAAAASGKYSDMYTRLNAGDMWHILRELESLWKRYGVLDLSPAGLQAQFRHVSSAPIFRERMKVAVAAVALAGVKTPIGFQKDYEAYLIILPVEQKQVLLEYLLERAPQRDQKVPNLLGDVAGLQLTPWRIVTSSGGAASLSYFTAGGGFLYLQHADRKDETYRFPYIGVGLGKSVSQASLTYSTKDFPSNGIGRLYRPGSRASGLMPSSFCGGGTLINLSAAALATPVNPMVAGPGVGIGAGAGVTLVMLATVGITSNYIDTNKLPDKAGAIGLMWGSVAYGGDKKVDAAVSVTFINVGQPSRVTL